jgi:hypothetical protein
LHDGFFFYSRHWRWLATDVKRFAVLLYPDGSTERQNPLHLTFLLNFGDELRRRVPVNK